MSDPAASPVSRPVAHRRPIARTHHGDTFDDPYEWLRDKDDPEVISYLEAENAYTEAQTGHLAVLRRRSSARSRRGPRKPTSVCRATPRTRADRPTGTTSGRSRDRSIRSTAGSRRPTADAARPRTGDHRRGGAAGRQSWRRKGTSSSPSAPSACRSTAGCSPTRRPHRRRAVHLDDQGPGDRVSCCRIRSTTPHTEWPGRRQSPLLHQGRRGLAAVRRPPAPAGDDR